MKVGDVIEGKYRIESHLGQGGMGNVYAGEHLKIRRRVAIKVLKGQFSGDEIMVERFEREALAASAISSRNVVEVFDVGVLETGEHYMILEFLEGHSLSRRFKKMRWMPPDDLFPLAVQLLSGLSAAHAQGIVHRDLKPGNVFITKDRNADDLVKIVDFGVSKFAQLSAEGGFTQTGAIVGTPHYMAPEQTRSAKDVDNRADIYSAGAILFRGLTGQTPFVAHTMHEMIAKLISQQAPPIRSKLSSVDEGVAAIVDRALQRDPDARYQSADAMVEAINIWLSGPVSGRTITRPLPLSEETPTPAPLMVTQPPETLLTPNSQGEMAATLSMPTPTPTSHLTPASVPIPEPRPTEPMMPESLPTPASLHTPSPSIQGPRSVSTVHAGETRPRVGLIVAVAVAALAVIAVVGVTFMRVPETTAETDDKPVAAPAQQPETAAATTADSAVEEVPSAPAPSASVSATAETKSEPVAKTRPIGPRRKTTPKRTSEPEPKAEPKPTGKGVDRDIRDDI